MTKNFACTLMIVAGICLGLVFHQNGFAKGEQIGAKAAANEELSGVVLNGVYVPSTVSKAWRD